MTPSVQRENRLTYVELSIDTVENEGRDQGSDGKEYEVQPEEVDFFLDPLAKAGVAVIDRVREGHAVVQTRARGQRE